MRPGRVGNALRRFAGDRPRSPWRCSLRPPTGSDTAAVSTIRTPRPSRWSRPGTRATRPIAACCCTSSRITARLRCTGTVLPRRSYPPTVCRRPGPQKNGTEPARAAPGEQGATPLGAIRARRSPPRSPPARSSLCAQRRVYALQGATAPRRRLEARDRTPCPLPVLCDRSRGFVQSSATHGHPSSRDLPRRRPSR